MEFDAFTAGVELGGLRSQSEIKILICYLLSSIEGGLSKNDIMKVFQEDAFANYFETNNAFSDLLENNNIVKAQQNQSKYIATESGKTIATQLEMSIPVSIREKAICSSLNLLANIKFKKENRVEVKSNCAGFNVTCHISGGERDLMSFSVQVPDALQAELIERNFHENPTLNYRYILALVTKNKDLIEDILRELLK